MANIKEYTDAELLLQLELAVVKRVKHESNAAYNKLSQLEKELASRLKISAEELEEIRRKLN